MASTSEPINRGFNVAAAAIQFREQTRTFHYHDTRLGRAVFQEVFAGKSYPFLPFITDVRTVVDVGANIGASTIFFAANYPQARILAFEPYPDSHALLVRNVEGLPQISTFNFGLFDHDKQAPLHLGLQDTVTNSIGASCEAAGDRDVMVNLRAASAVLTELNVLEIDVLKLDTEGCELPILRSMLAWMARVVVIYVEFHHESDRREIDRMLSPTHVLFRGHIADPHRGELCYVRRDRIPPQVEARAILL
jgi:FkbM family methyltransferase